MTEPNDRTGSLVRLSPAHCRLDDEPLRELAGFRADANEFSSRYFRRPSRLIRAWYPARS